MIDYVDAMDISEFDHWSLGGRPPPTKVRRCHWVAAYDHVASDATTPLPRSSRPTCSAPPHENGGTPPTSKLHISRFSPLDVTPF